MINLMVGGPRHLLPTHWKELPGQWVAVDRGTLTLLDAGIVPLAAVGDFDSMTEAEFARVKAAVATIHRSPAEKDDTDTELALELALAKGEPVRILGATGGRLDHLLGNLFLPTQPRFQAAAERISFLDVQNRVRFFLPGKHQLTKPAGYRYVGIVPLTGVDHLTIEGAKYPLHDWSSRTPFSWGSNEFVGSTPITLSFTAGVVAVIDTNDRQGQTVDN